MDPRLLGIARRKQRETVPWVLQVCRHPTRCLDDSCRAVVKCHHFDTDTTRGHGCDFVGANAPFDARYVAEVR